MENFKDSDVLVAARKRLQRQQNTFVCIAIKHTAIGSLVQKNRLVAWVEGMIAPFTYYSEWLAHHHPDLFDPENYSGPKLRRSRLAWLDWMIGHLQQRGE